MVKLIPFTSQADCWGFPSPSSSVRSAQSYAWLVLLGPITSAEGQPVIHPLSRVPILSVLLRRSWAANRERVSSLEFFPLGGWPTLWIFDFRVSFRNCGGLVLAFCARAGTMMPTA